MIEEGKCELMGDFEAIASLIFKNNAYIEKMNEAGLTVLFYGNLLGTDQPAYIALDLIPETGVPYYLDVYKYSRGYLDLSLLLESLKTWDWSSEGRHTVHIETEDANIELNISVYTLGWDIGRQAIPANRRLVGNDGAGLLQSAICFGKNDPSLSMNVLLCQGSLIYIGEIGGRDMVRHFYLTDATESCSCGLEERLKQYTSVKQNPNQSFRGLEISSLATQENESGLLSARAGDAQQRHVSTWRHVFRAVSRYKELLSATETREQSVEPNQPEKNVFLAGLEVKSLYNGNWEGSRKIHHAILGLTPNVRTTALNFETRSIANLATLNRTDTSPFIVLHIWPKDPSFRIFVHNLDEYVEYNNGRLAIPILYLRDTDYTLKDVVVEYKYNDRGLGVAKHIYTFTANGVTVIMAEFDEEREPWHLRRKALLHK
ncbi:hypothetical protein NQ176_g7127 [Zarea fungicola]|uniref:Uncharacterized protein n=1 Tax=Zarea fungicola TaxID=93591 RepID=A0ACC1N138_9HYPO|nr:hypothetical protein NQ176_g7127 [Lecanicillium fungicola]